MLFVYQFLNIFFFVFHTTLIFFNLFGWFFKRTRFLNLITLLLTAFSWFFLGIWYGWGYCFCTDWHWQIRQKLGYSDVSSSYIDFLIIQITGLQFNYLTIQIMTLVLFFSALVISIILNFRAYHKRSK